MPRDSMKSGIPEKTPEQDIKKEDLVVEEPVAIIAEGILAEWMVQGLKVEKFDQYISQVEDTYQDLRESSKTAYKKFIIRDLRSVVIFIARDLIKRITDEQINGATFYTKKIGEFQELLRKFTDTINSALILLYGQEPFEKVIVPDLHVHLGVEKDKQEETK